MRHSLQAGFEPPEKCFRVAASACVESGQWSTAVSLLGAMRVCLPDWESALISRIGCPDLQRARFKTLLATCQKARDWASALAVLDQMEAVDCAPCAEDFDQVASTCELAGQYGWAAVYQGLGDLLTSDIAHVKDANDEQGLKKWTI